MTRTDEIATASNLNDLRAEYRRLRAACLELGLVRTAKCFERACAHNGAFDGASAVAWVAAATWTAQALAQSEGKLDAFYSAMEPQDAPCTAAAYDQAYGW